MDISSGAELLTASARLRVRGLIGVFSRDTAPVLRAGQCMIVNLQGVSEGPGTHWLACRRSRSGRLYFFDSYGLDAPLELDPSDRAVQTRVQLQAANDTWCGAAAVVWLAANIDSPEKYLRWLSQFELTEDARAFAANKRIVRRLFSGR
jgi:hypothetical protein